MADQLPKTEKHLSYARKLFVLTIITIFVFEFLIMILLEYVLSYSEELDVVLDAVLVTLLVFPILYLAVFRPLERDIGEREKVESALFKSTKKYQMLVENLEEGVVLEDAKGFISFVNPRVAEMLGYSKQDLIGEHWTKIVPSEELNKVKEENAKRQQVKQSRYVTNILTSEGFQIPVQISANPIFTGENDFQGVLSVLTDITEQKKLQQLQERFIATTNHELRTPVTVIKGYIDFLRKNPHQPMIKVEQIYQKLHSNINRLSGLINNVHVLSKITQDVFKLSPSQTDFNDFVKILQEQCLVLYPSRSILINYLQYSNNTPILIDQDCLLQVLHNLVSNAIKNSSRTSVVDVTIVKNTSDLRFTVQDYGVGISLPNFFHLFRPFTHFDTQYTTRGTGVGLYIVKSIVLAQGGRIEVLSEEHFGSSFTITLPIS